MLLVWVVGCGADGFVEDPVVWADDGPTGMLRVPSLADCTYEQADADDLVPMGRDVRLTYDERGRLESADASEFTEPLHAQYLWTGDCLARIDRQEGGIAYHEEFTCDERANPTSWTVSRIFGPREMVVQSTETYVNHYDALGQLIQVDITTDGAATWTIEQLWDGQRRVAQRDTTDLLIGEEIRRQFWWDHDRLLGFEDRGPREDFAMDRLFDRHRLLSQNDWLDEVVVVETGWTYDGDALWPEVRTTNLGAGGYLLQEVTVTCDR